MNHYEHLLQEMSLQISSLLPSDGTLEPVPGVRLHRVSRLTERIFGESRPAFCVVAQGAKEIYLGGRSYRYDTHQYLLATMEMPVTAIILEASGPLPYLSFQMELDPALVASVMMECGLLPPSRTEEAPAFGVSTLDLELLDASVRLVRTLSEPRQTQFLLPLIRREIVYRLLMGDHSERVRHLPGSGGDTRRIARALQKLRENFDKPLSIERLAQELGMSSTRFYSHFKNVTDVSPLQFQKTLRLQEARRLMLSEELDAASAGYRVGYEDSSYFNRDYKKHFGESPRRDIERVRQADRQVLR